MRPNERCGEAPLTGQKTALVTGAGLRIGAVIAEGLADRGFALALHYRHSQKQAESLAGRIENKGGRAACFRADLAQEAETESLIPRVMDSGLPPLDVLINNASLFEKDDWHSPEFWDKHFQVNLRAPFLLAREFALSVKNRPGNGRNTRPGGDSGHTEEQAVIINMIDQRVWNLTPYFFSYTLSKSALWTMTQTLAMALAPRIRVNAIGPGPSLPSRFQTAAEFESQYQKTILQRPSAPEDIMRAVAFILETPSLTGHMIPVDSGQHLGRAPTRSGED